MNKIELKNKIMEQLLPEVKEKVDKWIELQSEELSDKTILYELSVKLFYEQEKKEEPRD